MGLLKNGVYSAPQKIQWLTVNLHPPHWNGHILGVTQTDPRITLLVVYPVMLYLHFSGYIPSHLVITIQSSLHHQPLALAPPEEVHNAEPLEDEPTNAEPALLQAQRWGISPAKNGEFTTKSGFSAGKRWGLSHVHMAMCHVLSVWNWGV